MPFNQSLDEQPGYLSVSELHQRLNRVLKAHASQLAFQGEVSQVTRAKSGHLYLTIKDERSQVSAVMWSSSVQRLGFSVEEGLSVLCEGDANIYQGNGKFQIVLSRILEAGEGLLRKKYLELKAKLEKEGLFDPERKRPLPFLPRSVGIVTSQSGAAIHDIMTKIHERMPQTKVFLYDARVQGAGSAQEVVAGIAWFNHQQSVDVLIIGRGGGSLEDLWTFNEEIVARAVFASKIPIISAVGHEVDIALTDLVADFRAPTPTAAGERVVPSRKDLLDQLERFDQRLNQFDFWFTPLSQRVDELEMRLNGVAGRVLSEAKRRLESLRADLNACRPGRLLSDLRGRIDLYAERLQSGVRSCFVHEQGKLSLLQSRLIPRELKRKIGQAHVSLQSMDTRISRAVRVLVAERALTIQRLQETLIAVSPTRVLERGYSIVSYDGKAVRSADSLKEGDALSLTFHRGRVEASVQSVYKQPPLKDE